MRHFQPSEFREWFDRMSPRLLEVLDEFRELWGQPVTISPHPDALGRMMDQGQASQHNFNQWGEVRAADIFPKGMIGSADFARAYNLAKQAGASGIGVYTDTRPGPMLHLDVRIDKTPANPARWARIKDDGESIYVGMARVMPRGWRA